MAIAACVSRLQSEPHAWEGLLQLDSFAGSHSCFIISDDFSAFSGSSSTGYYARLREEGENPSYGCERASDEETAGTMYFTQQESCHVKQKDAAPARSWTGISFGGRSSCGSCVGGAGDHSPGL